MKHRITDLGPVEHDGKLYQAGDELDLSAATAEALVALGVVELVEKKAREAGV